MIDKPVDRSIDDSTIDGYLRRHDRPPAFAGSDGHAYSLSVYVDPNPVDDGRFGAALVFVRWSAAGDQPAGHVETDFLGFGATPKAAAAQVRRLTLHEAKQQLDRAIARRKDMGDW